MISYLFSTGKACGWWALSSPAGVAMARDSRSTFRQQNKTKKKGIKQKWGTGKKWEQEKTISRWPGASLGRTDMVCGCLPSPIIRSWWAVGSPVQLPAPLPWYKCGAALGDQPSNVVTLWARWACSLKPQLTIWLTVSIWRVPFI